MVPTHILCEQKIIESRAKLLDNGTGSLRHIYSVNKYRHYLLGRKFSFHVDHFTLLYIVSKASLTSKLARWTLLLQAFDLDIYHRPGVQHVVRL